MNIKLVKEKITSKLFIGYLELVAKTSHIVFENKEKITEESLKNCILGFWHGDSYTMNLVIKSLATKDMNISAIVTADERGNYIENVLNYYGTEALRMPDGVKMRGFLRELKEESKKENSILAIALDGPLGPLHEPKKIAFLLSNESQKNFIGIKLDYSKKISLTKRWDNYAIPLPFTKTNISASNCGVTRKTDLQNFKEYSELIKDVYNAA